VQADSVVCPSNCCTSKGSFVGPLGGDRCHPSLDGGLQAVKAQEDGEGVASADLGRAGEELVQLAQSDGYLLIGEPAHEDDPGLEPVGVVVHAASPQSVRTAM
jgi:hypothetical protein